MAVTHHALVRNSIADTVLAAIDQDGGGSPEVKGALIFYTAASPRVAAATLTLPYPAGTVSGETLTFGTIASDTSATGGTISNFVITDNSGDEILYGSVGVSASPTVDDIILSSLAVTGGDTVSVSALTYDAPA